MAVFELVIVLLFGGAMLAALARRINVPYPALLALTGAALALLPGTPSVTLDPQLALALFVAPVLLDAAFDSSPRDLRQNWRAVTSLALIAVGLTVAAVAVAVRWVVPDMPWSVAIALGAIVAPPDAAAATAVLRQLRAPHRVFVILEGESLFNDASALLIYRLAVAATITGSFSGWSAIPMLVVVCAGSVLFGYLLSRLLTRVMPHITDVATSVIVQFVSTFGVWIAAERIGLSGIITMVVYAIAVARTAPDRFPARLRIPSYAVWEVVVFVLNVLAFILVGLQLKPILQRLSEQELLALCGGRGRGLRGRHCHQNRMGDGLCACGAHRLTASAGDCPIRAVPIVSGWCGDRVVRHARDRHDRGGAGASRWRRLRRGVSLSRPHSVHRVLRGARHARFAGTHRDAPHARARASSGRHG